MTKVNADLLGVYGYLYRECGHAEPRRHARSRLAHARCNSKADTFTAVCRHHRPPAASLMMISSERGHVVILSAVVDLNDVGCQCHDARRTAEFKQVRQEKIGH